MDPSRLISGRVGPFSKPECSQHGTVGTHRSDSTASSLSYEHVRDWTNKGGFSLILWNEMFTSGFHVKLFYISHWSLESTSKQLNRLILIIHLEKRRIQHRVSAQFSFNVNEDGNTFALMKHSDTRCLKGEQQEAVKSIRLESVRLKQQEMNKYIIIGAVVQQVQQDTSASAGATEESINLPAATTWIIYPVCGHNSRASSKKT